MEVYFPRKAEQEVLRLVSFFPVVAVVGPRQVGKTSLVQALQAQLPRDSVYLDLENPDDLFKLENPSLFLDTYADQTVIMDEVQKMPQLFPVLRGIIDRNRQAGRFILLGSASPDLIRDSSETLAGRIAYFELRPFSWEELPTGVGYQAHWVRGGFPEALFAPSEELASLWRRNFIQTYLEKDLPMLGLSADPVLIRKLWQMIAHLSGQVLNMEKLAASLGIHGTTVRRYLHFLEAAYLIRLLPPFFSNLKKRLVKSPKLYLRDTGILHQLLSIPSFFELSGHPVLGASWETYVIEQLAALAPDWAELFFYRTHSGTEADVVIARAGKPEILIEIKYSTTPKPSRGFYTAAADLGVQRQFVVAPVERSFPLSEAVQVLGLSDLKRVFE